MEVACGTGRHSVAGLATCRPGGRLGAAPGDRAGVRLLDTPVRAKAVSVEVGVRMSDQGG